MLRSSAAAVGAEGLPPARSQKIAAPGPEDGRPKLRLVGSLFTSGAAGIGAAAARALCVSSTAPLSDSRGVTVPRTVEITDPVVLGHTGHRLQGAANLAWPVRSTINANKPFNIEA